MSGAAGYCLSYRVLAAMHRVTGETCRDRQTQSSLCFQRFGLPRPTRLVAVVAAAAASGQPCPVLLQPHVLAHEGHFCFDAGMRPVAFITVKLPDGSLVRELR